MGESYGCAGPLFAPQWQVVPIPPWRVASAPPSRRRAPGGSQTTGATSTRAGAPRRAAARTAAATASACDACSTSTRPEPPSGPPAQAATRACAAAASPIYRPVHVARRRRPPCLSTRFGRGGWSRFACRRKEPRPSHGGVRGRQRVSAGGQGDCRRTGGLCRTERCSAEVLCHARRCGRGGARRPRGPRRPWSTRGRIGWMECQCGGHPARCPNRARDGTGVRGPRRASSAIA